MAADDSGTRGGGARNGGVVQRKDGAGVMDTNGSVTRALVTLWHRFYVLQDYRQVGKWIRIAMQRAGVPLCDDHDWDPNCKACDERLEAK